MGVRSGRGSSACLLCGTLALLAGCGATGESAAAAPVATPPVASFTLAPEAPVAGQVVQLGDTSSGTPTAWSWSFGDGGTSTARNPAHAWAASGTYTVTLTAVNGAGSGSTSRALVVAQAPAATLPYVVVDTGQARTWGASTEIAPPAAGQPFYGQDAQFSGTQPAYAVSDDGRTVRDLATGLTWMRGPNTTLAAPTAADKKTRAQAQAWVATVNGLAWGGHSDWRLPSIKDLYSLMDFRGMDPSGFTGTDTSSLTPFIDRTAFLFAYGQTSAGERIIDSQYASSDLFVVNPAETGSPKLFGLNLADGRIKGYDLVLPDGRTEKTFFVQLVRGPATYGVNDLRDGGDGTVTDAATGLMWSRADSGTPMTWQDALAWVQARNAERWLGHGDWRMPNAKELQSLVSYAHAPDFDGQPAIDGGRFATTGIVNENGEADFPYFWASTTHATFNGMGASAVYVAFGRCLGWPTGASRWVDVHGAGCQRSDPKVGPPFAWATTHVVTRNGSSYTGHAFGPQGDALRGLNFVRPVRDAR